MKRNILSLAVAATVAGGAVGTANAMYVNDKGLGEALVYPFYSAANGNDTYISIVNTTGLTKAVKVRFIEALNSEEVLDFNLYLSPEDVWAGVITANPNGDGAIIRTVDTSCTVPELGTAGGANVGELAGTKTDLAGGFIRRDQPFVPFFFDSDDEVTGNERTLEGYVEVFEMGQLDPNFLGSAFENFGYSAVHVPNSDGPETPRDCANLVAAWTSGGSSGGEWVADRTEELLPWQGGGLYGYGVVINPGDGTAAGYDAIAISDYKDPIRGLQDYHNEPGSILPNFTAANPSVTVFDGTSPVTLNFAGTSAPATEALDAASTLFMTLNVANDYVVDPDINALTDWVLTMPTKKAYTTPPAVDSNGDRIPARPPFTNRWDGSGACEPIGIVSWNREESPQIIDPDGPVFSPQPGPVTPGDFAICTEASVLSFGETSALNATENVLYGFDPNEPSGWARVSFDPDDTNTSLDDATRVLTAGGVSVYGLPAVGFAVQKYQNTDLSGGGSGVVANYAAAVEHKAVLSIETP